MTSTLRLNALFVAVNACGLLSILVGPLVADVRAAEWKMVWHDEFDRDGKPEGQSGSAPGSGKGAAGVVEKDGHFILFQ